MLDMTLQHYVRVTKHAPAMCVWPPREPASLSTRLAYASLLIETGAVLPASSQETPLNYPLWRQPKEHDHMTSALSSSNGNVARVRI